MDSGWEAARRRSAALPATSLECEPPTAGGGCDCESWERGVCEQGGVYISSTSPAASHFGGDLWRPAHWGRLVWWIQCEGHRRLGAELRGRRWKCVHRWLGRAATARAFVGTTTHGHGMPFACRLRSSSGCWWSTGRWETDGGDHRAMAQRRRCSDVHSRAFGAFYATRFDSDPFRRGGRRGRLPLRSCARSQPKKNE